MAQLIAQLDSTAADIIEHQKDALLERKEVAQKTKDFKRLDDVGKLSEYKNLLKTYQGFVDLLTTHGKESSAAFLQIYTTLSEAPDPFPLLEASIEALVVSEDVVPRLTNENLELQKRVKKLTSELETTEARLRRETNARDSAETDSGQKLAQVEASWRQAIQEKEENWVTRERALADKIEAQDRLYKELKANYEVSQRLDQDDRDTTAEKTISAELQMVTADLEGTSRRLADVEARNESMRIELAQARTQSSQSADGDAQVLRLQTENSSLLRKLDALRFDREAEKRKQDDRTRQLERQRQSAQDDASDLRTKLQKQADYEDIKRELYMLRSIELSADNELDDDGAAADVPTETPKSESLEQLLLNRNKKLGSDLTLLRVAHKELIDQLDHLKVELNQSRTDLEKSQRLTSQLETDIERLQEEAAHGVRSSGMSVAGTYTSRYPGSGRRGRASPTSSIISGFDSTSRTDLLRGEPMGGGSGILPMVQAQRDRFKQKTQQLEEELQKTYTTVTALRQEIASLQKDNLKLYEKSRYVSAYNRSGTSTSAYGQGTTNTSIEDTEDGTASKWRSQYEANLSPFAAFRGRETTRAYSRMSLPERMVFSFMRTVLATRTSRNLFAGYCLALHLVLVLMLYWTSAANAAAIRLGGTAAAVAGLDAVKNLADRHEEGSG